MCTCVWAWCIRRQVISKDKNVMLVTVAIKCVGCLAAGLRKKFSTYSASVRTARCCPLAAASRNDSRGSLGGAGLPPARGSTRFVAYSDVSIRRGGSDCLVDKLIFVVCVIECMFVQSFLLTLLCHWNSCCGIRKSKVPVDNNNVHETGEDFFVYIMTWCWP